MLKEKRKKNILWSMSLGLLLLFLPIFHAQAATSYDVTVELYEFTQGDTGDFLADFQDGAATKIDDGAMLNPGDMIAVGMKYKVGDPANCMLIQIGLNYPDAILELYTDDGFIYYEFDKRAEVDGGVYPGTGTKKNRVNWTMLDPHDLSIDNEIPGYRQINGTLGDETINQTVLTHPGGILFFYFFTVKESATPGADIKFTFDDANNACSDPIGTSSVVTSTPVSYKVYEAPPVLSNDTSLSSVVVKNGSTNYNLNISGANQEIYSTVIPSKIDKVTIEAVTTDSKATILPGGLGEKTANVGDNSYQFTVTAEDGTTKIYQVKVKRLSNDASLNSLNISEGTLSPGFNPGTTSYKANVPYQTKSINVSATPVSTAKINSGTGAWNLNVGANQKEVVVHAEDCDASYSSVPGNSCTEKKYQLEVTRAEASKDASLSDIKVNNTSIPGFSSTTLSYSLDAVKNNVTSLKVDAIKKDNNASVEITGNNALKVGDNTITIKVTAEDGVTTSTYTLNVRRQSNDATLKTLTITSTPEGSLDKPFQSNTTAYTYTYKEGTTKVTINGTATDASIQKIEGLREYDLATETAATIKVTAEDDTTKTYTITFTREKSNNANLKSLSVEKDGTNYSFDETFNENTTDYHVTVPNEVSEVTIKGETASEYARISGVGNTSLKYGENEKIVAVTAEDGKTTKNYKITITRELSSDATLTDVKVNNTSIIGFTSTTLNYTLDDISSSINSLNITYTKGHEASTVEINGANNLVEGQENTITIKVTSQDKSTTNTYTLTVYRKSSDANLTSLTVTSNPMGTLDPTFSSNQTKYTYNYDRSVNDITIAAEANDKATVVGARTYQVSEKSATITVTPEDGQVKTYEIQFKQIEENDSSLKELSVEQDGTNILTDFRSDKITYSLNVKEDVDQVEIKATPTGDYTKSVTGTGVKTLSPGTNEFKVIITAEDGSQTTYTITINRAINTSAKLEEIQIDDVPIPDFSSNKTTYNLDSVNYTKDKIKISATPTKGATISGDGEKTLVVGDNTFELTVTAEDGVTKNVYTIHVRRKSNVVTLDSLSASKGTLDPTFSSNQTNYKLKVGADVTTITINATASAGATIKNADDLKDIDISKTKTVQIEVEAEDNNYQNTYTINIEQEASNNNFLSSLSISEGSLNETFDKTKTTYTATVPENIESLEILATAEDQRSTVTGTGSKTLNYGENSFEIIVTAEDTSTKTYTLIVTRLKKSDNSLKSLTSNVGTITPNLDADPGVEYTLVLPEGTQKFQLTAIASDKDATVVGAEEYTLPVPNNKVLITVTAMNGDNRIYTINVEVTKNQNNNLASLEVEGYPLNETFDKDTLAYTLKVPNSVTTVVINARKEMPSSKLEMGKQGSSLVEQDSFQMNDLALGENIVEIKVTSESGDEKTYKITITREEISIPDKITSSIYQVNDDHIIGIKVLTDTNQFKDNLDNDNAYIEIYEADGNTLVAEDGIIGTGMIVKLVINGNVADQKEIVVLGDTTGDGAIDLLDAVKVTNHYIDKQLLTGVYYIAGNIINTDEIDLLDAVKIINHYIDKAVID